MIVILLCIVIEWLYNILYVFSRAEQNIVSVIGLAIVLVV